MPSQGNLSETPVDRFDGWLDRSYDHQFKSLGLKWLPWVGSRFQDQQIRTIVLGESVYDYSAGDRSKRDWILRPDSLRIRHLNHAILSKFNSKYVRNFERAYYGVKKTSVAQRQVLWSGVLYHNLVLEMLNSRNKRPSDAAYVAGWETFLRMAATVGAQEVIVYGLERTKVDALRALRPSSRPIDLGETGATSRFKPPALQVELTPGHHARMLFIRHPSAFFSWSEWSPVLQAFRRLEGEVTPNAPQ